MRAGLPALVLAVVACGQPGLLATGDAGTDASDERASVGGADTGGGDSSAATDMGSPDAALEGAARPPDAMADGCRPVTCQDLGYDCGSADDGCGKHLDCGTCSPPTSCGVFGFNKCSTVPVPFSCPLQGCAPLGCERLGYDCGLAGDGCGGVLDCGRCPSPDVCSANRCVWPPDAGSCVPATCQEYGATCASVGDGCGRTLDCGGPCPVSQFCGGGGVRRCGGTCIAPDGGPSLDCGIVCTSPEGGPPCLGESCAQAGRVCGYAPNGCGGLVDCGPCAGDAGASDAGGPDAAIDSAGD